MNFSSAVFDPIMSTIEFMYEGNLYVCFVIGLLMLA